MVEPGDLDVAGGGSDNGFLDWPPGSGIDVLDGNNLAGDGGGTIILITVGVVMEQVLDSNNA